MAYLKELKVSQALTGASYDSTAQEFTIPLTALADGTNNTGLDASEVDDGRKFMLAILRAFFTEQQAIADGYTASQALSAWVSGSAYNTGDKVLHSGAQYTALNTLANSTSSPDADVANWQEDDIYQPTANFTVSQANPSLVSGTNGAEQTQNFTISFRYTNSFDVKAEA